MEDMSITKIELTGNRGLVVTPENNDRKTFRFVYRDDTNIEWDEESQSIYDLHSNNKTEFEIYQSILGAVFRELGLSLKPTEATQWLNISHTLKKEITDCASYKIT